MPLFSAFTPFGQLAFKSGPSLAEKTYRALIAMKADAFDMSKGTHEEAKAYAQAMGIARGQNALNRALGQLDPFKCIELLNKVEHDWGIIPSELATIFDRQVALAARMVLSRGATRESIEEGLRLILGSHFVALRFVQPSEATEYLGPSNFARPDLPFKLVRLIDPVTSTGTPVDVDYETADSTAAPHILRPGEKLMVQPNNTGLSEQIEIISATDKTLTAIFTNPHDEGAYATTQNWVSWISSQRTIFVVADEAGANNRELCRRVDAFMDIICRGVSFWEIVTPNPTSVGPFTLNVSGLGMATIESLNPTPNVLPFLGNLNHSEGVLSSWHPLVIHGIRFETVSSVTFNGAAVAYTADNSSGSFVHIAFNAPPVTDPTLAGPVDLVVVTDRGTVTKKNAFRYIHRTPKITTVTPASGRGGGGTAITILGSGFLHASGVRINGVLATSVVVADDGTITCVTPATTGVFGPVDVVVYNPEKNSGTSGAGKFEYTYTKPIITSITPSSGPYTAYTPVTLIGTNFLGTSLVFVGDGERNYALGKHQFEVVSDTEIRMTILPFAAPDMVLVILFNPAHQHNGDTTLFEYT